MVALNVGLAAPKALLAVFPVTISGAWLTTMVAELLLVRKEPAAL
jgi:hypothetical protein